MKRTLYLIGLSVMLIAAPLAAVAQTPAGSLSGNVVDMNGAAVAGATVTVTDNATNQSRTVETNTQGTFAVPPGRIRHLHGKHYCGWF